jgi:hypothetical protein
MADVLKNAHGNLEHRVEQRSARAALLRCHQKPESVPRLESRAPAGGLCRSRRFFHFRI